MLLGFMRDERKEWLGRERGRGGGEGEGREGKGE